MQEHIVANANLVVSQFQELTDFEFGYNQSSIEWIDGFVNRQRERDDFSVELGENMTSTIGSFLGQCILECYGGNWKETSDGWGIEFSDGNMAYPFSKTAKHFENGAENSILSFFTTIPIIFQSSIKQHRKKWWDIWS